jgi:hypothetical protein
MGGHVFAEIVKISDKDTPAHRNTDTSNVLFPGVSVGFGVGVGVGGKFPCVTLIGRPRPQNDDRG